MEEAMCMDSGADANTFLRQLHSAARDVLTLNWETIYLLKGDSLSKQKVFFSRGTMG